MSCNGCRVLRKGCGENCVLRPCLEWIQSHDPQGHATLFISKFFGCSDLINFITAISSDNQRTDLLEAAVETVLSYGFPIPIGDETSIAEVDKSSEVFNARGEWAMTIIRKQTNACNSNAVPLANIVIADDNIRSILIIPASDITMDLGMSSRRSDGEEPKLLNLF